MVHDSEGAVGYWVLVSLLWLFGVISIFSIGMPLLLLGATLAVVAPWRGQPAVLWPAVTAVVALVVGYVLVAPLGCTTALPDGTTTCTNLLGIDYTGGGSYNPSLVPALLAGLVLAVLTAATVRVILRRRQRGPTP